MLKVDDYLIIRQASRTMGVRAIARTYGYSRKVIRKALREPEPQPYQLTVPRPCPVLGPYHAAIDQILAEDVHAPPKQRHTMMQVYRRLVDEHGYLGGYDAVRRYIGQHRQQDRETFVPLDHDPGVRLEADFGHIHVDFPAGRRLVPVLVVTWSYSNAPFAMALPTERIESVLAGTVDAFEFYGAVPMEVWWDNPKTIATVILKGRERRFHERWLALASHYRFEPRACMPRRPQEKPRVENRVKDLQRRWATPVPKAADLDELNAWLRTCCQREQSRTQQRQVQSIGERLCDDLAAALPLPPRPFEPCVRQEAVVDKYQTVRYDNVFYSVPHHAAFGQVTIKASVDRIEVVAKGATIADHPRCYAPHQQILDPLHYLPTLDRRPASLDHARVYRQWDLPPVFGQLREQLERRAGATTGRRQYVAVLKLLLDHPLPQVERAIARQLALGPVDAGAIRLALDRQPLPTGTDLSGYQVPLPDLSQFDRLLTEGVTHA